MTTSMITTNDPAGQMLALDTDPDTIHFSITYEHKRSDHKRSDQPWKLTSLTRLAQLALPGWNNFHTMEGAQWAALAAITEALHLDTQPHDVHEFQGGGKYDERGQLMRAVVIDKLRIAWFDLSRGIHGIAHIFEANNAETMSLGNIQQEVMNHYNSNDYEYPKGQEEQTAISRLS